jgi:hypothetical protein
MSKISGLSEKECFASIVMLWHSSQAAGLDCADSEQICIWADVYENEQKFIEAMCHRAVHYLEKIDDDLFRIIGNDHQLESLQRMKERGKKGAIARWKKQNPVGNDASSMDTDASSNAKAKAKHSSSNAGAMHKNAQYNAEQSSSVQDNADHLIQGDCADAGQTDLKLGQDPPTGKSRKKKTPKKKERELTWSDDNPYGKVLALLVSLEAYNRVFDAPTDTAKLAQFKEVYKLTDVELYKQVFTFVNWYQKKSMKSPRGALAGWLGRYEKERDDKIARDPKRKLENRKKVDFGSPRDSRHTPF